MYDPITLTAQPTPTPETHIVDVSVQRLDTQTSTVITVIYQGGISENSLIGLGISGSGMIPRIMGSTLGNKILPLNSQITIPATETPVTKDRTHEGKVHVIIVGYFIDGVEQNEYDNYL